MRDVRAKIVTLEQALEVRQRLRAEGRRVAFTNGCYDLLHAGHVCSIGFAREQGDALLVGMNSDRSVRALKGPKRPIIPERERAIMLAALEAVDWVVVFDATEVLPVIEVLVPDVLVKGADRAGDVVGREVVEAAGGEVVLAELVEGFSTTNIIARVTEQYS